MKLSIIIPIYKTQDTLDRCIGSILRQSFTDYELLLVDDGSPDECPRLCDEYAQKDQRISVIHKENGGLSNARNAGIEQAKGEYITFIDSDDAIEEDTLQLLVDELEEHPYIDVLEYPIKERIGNPNREKSFHSNLRNMMTLWIIGWAKRLLLTLMLATRYSNSIYSKTSDFLREKTSKMF